MEMRAFTRLVWVVVLGCSACSTRSLDYLSEHENDGNALPDRNAQRAPSSTDTAPSKPTALPTETVLADLQYPTLLVSDAESLYWFDQATREIVTMKKADGARAVLVRDVASPPIDIVVDKSASGYLYWADHSGAVTSALKASPNQVGDFAFWKPTNTSPSVKPVSLALDDDSLYAALHDEKGEDPGGILRFPRANMVLPTSFVKGGFPRAVVERDDRLFWFGLRAADQTSGTAYSSKLDAPSTEQYGASSALDGVAPRRFAVTNDAVYAASDAELVRMPLVRDATPRSAKIDGMKVKAIAVDDEFVWVCDASGRILRQRKDWTATTPDVVVEGLGVPTAIVADAAAIWFVTERSAAAADGKLVKIARTRAE